MKNYLKTVWNHSIYQNLAKDKIIRKWKDNPAYQEILAQADGASQIGEFGCSQAVFLKILKNIYKKKLMIGLDISFSALLTAKNSRLVLLQSDIRKAPIMDSSLDLVFSVHTLEHVKNPQQAVDEMIRVLKPGGKLIIVCPNLGSPMAKLPGKSWQKTVIRFPKKLIKNITNIFISDKDLSWESFSPVSSSIDEYEPDHDVVCLPDLQSLEIYFKRKRMSIELLSSGLDWEKHLEKEKKLSRKNRTQKILEYLSFPIYFLGRLNIPPFKYFGFICFLVAKK